MRELCDMSERKHTPHPSHGELFYPDQIPFNLSGEQIDNSVTDEGEARVRALAEREARKAQLLIDLDTVTFRLPAELRTMAAVSRWPMCGGGTAYSVRFFKSDKPSHPLHGSTYCTTICGTFQGKHREMFEVVDAIDPRSHWSMDLGFEKYDVYKRLEKRADRLAVRIAKRVFPELKGARKLPALWTSETRTAEEHLVPVRMTLPD